MKKRFNSNYRPREKRDDAIKLWSLERRAFDALRTDEEFEEAFRREPEQIGKMGLDNNKDYEEVPTDKEDVSYRELDEDGRYVDATGDPVDEDYDEQERLRHLRDAEDLFRRILERDPDEDDGNERHADSEEIAEALEDLFETIVQGADEIGQLIRDGIDDIISAI